MRQHSQRARQGAPCRSEVRLAGHCRVKGDRSLFWVVLRLAWKLSRRRWKRQSPLLGGIAVLVTVIGVGSAVTALFMAYLLGVSLLPGLEPFTVLLVWDAVIVAFLILWLSGLLVQLQLGGESLALEKLRHMPVSPMGAFLMNFASAQMRVSLVISLAVMLGLAGARRIPEHSRAVAGVAMRLWIRAPQGKIVLLSPLLLIMLYLIMFRQIGSGDWAAHFAVLAMLALTIVMGFNLFANVFGQDGSGFRSVVMAGVQSKDLLLGKNLALAPYAFGIGLLAIVILQWMSPLRLTDVFANVAQLVILYLVGCMLGNSFSIRTPWAMSTTSMGMRNASAAMFLASFLIILMLALLVLPLALPMWIDRLLAAKGVLVPVYLVFSIIELVVVIAIYRRVLRSQAELLTERFESVLERVTEPVD